MSVGVLFENDNTFIYKNYFRDMLTTKVFTIERPWPNLVGRSIFI